MAALSIGTCVVKSNAASAMGAVADEVNWLTASSIDERATIVDKSFHIGDWELDLIDRHYTGFLDCMAEQGKPLTTI